MKTAVLVSGLLGTLVAAAPRIEPRQNGGCAPVHILVARASTEPQGEGMIGSLSRSVKSSIPGTTSEALVYPAALAPYGPSEIKGVAAAKSQLAAYAQKCPKAKLVLMGYSQGADVVVSVTCGSGGFSGAMKGAKVELGPVLGQLDPAVGKNIVAIVGMGDPRFTKGMPFNKGTAKGTGRFPHPPEHNCRGYESRMVSYCDSGDEFCDNGTSLATHAGYMGKYTTAAATFIKEKVKNLNVPVPLDGGGSTALPILPKIVAPAPKSAPVPAAEEE